MGGVREVAFLGRVRREVVELVFVGLRLGDGDCLAAVQTLVALAGDRPELLVVVVAGELDQVLLAVDVDLGDDGLDVVGLRNGRVNVGLSGDALKRARGLDAALADLVVGREQDWLGGRLGLGSCGSPQRGRVRPTGARRCGRQPAWRAPRS